jgi:DNA polymerase sigma
MEEQMERTLLTLYGPDRPSILQREFAVKLIHQIVFSTFPGCPFRISEYGSLPLRTFLKSGDVDITLITDPPPAETVTLAILNRLKLQFECWQRMNPALCIQETQIIAAEVPIFKFKVNKVSADITINQVNGLKTVTLLENINEIIGSDLYRRSIIIGKIWALHFGRILGGVHSGLTSYALEVLLLFVINTIPASRSSPISVLTHFLSFFSQFDWENSVLAFHKVFSVSEYVSLITHKKGLNSSNEQLIVTDDHVAKIREKVGATKEARLMPLKFINIIDPIESSNNLGRSVSQANSERIKTVFKVSFEILQQKGIEKLLTPAASEPSPQIVLKDGRVPLAALTNRFRTNVGCDLRKEVYRKTGESARRLFARTQKISIRA